MNKRFKKFLALPIALSALLVALFASAFVPTAALAETSFNLDDWDYQIKTINRGTAEAPAEDEQAVLLYTYKETGTDTVCEIPATVELDGTTYSVGLLRDKTIRDQNEREGKYVDFGSITVLSFEEGVYVDDYKYLFAGNDNLVEVNLRGLNAAPGPTSEGTTSAAGMFMYCDNLKDVYGLKTVFTSKLTSTSNMFAHCKKLEGVAAGLGTIDTSNVTDMRCMFIGCESLKNISFLDQFDTSSTTNMFAMFMLCKSLNSLNLMSFDTSAVTEMDNIFTGCESLIAIGFSSSDQDGGPEYQTTDPEAQASAFKVPANAILGIPTVVGYKGGYLCSGLWIQYPFDQNTPITAEAFEAQAIAGGSISGIWYVQDAIPDWDYQVVIDEGTGTSKVVLKTYTGTETTYTVPASYTCGDTTYSVELSSSGLDFGTIEDLSFEDGVYAQSPEGLFEDCTDLKTIKLAGLKFIDSSSMDYMFYGCDSLTSIDFAGFDSSKTKSAASMFALCSSLESIDLDGLDTSSLTNMEGMFLYCEALKEVSFGSIDTSKVTKMTGLFYYCQELESLDLSGFDTSNVVDMQIMFDGCTSLSKINFGENFVISESTNVDRMFSKPAITGYDAVSNGTWGKDTELAETQYTAEELAELGQSEGKLTGAWYAQADVQNDWTYCPTTIDGQDYIVLFTYMGTETNYKIPAQMTVGETTYKVAITGDDKHTMDPGTIQNLSFEQGVYAIDMYALFMKTNLVSVDFTGLDTSDVTDWDGLFYKCTSLKSVTFGDIDTSKVEDMSWLFTGCTSLEEVDFGSVTTSKVTAMNNMFEGCSALTAIDVSSFDTSHVEDMCQMFYECSALTELDLSNFDLSSIKTTQETKDDGTVVDWAHVDYLLDGCTSLTKLVLGENFVVPAGIEVVFPEPVKTASGSESAGTWGLGSENAKTSYDAAGLAKLGQTAGALKGTWYAQAKAADDDDKGDDKGDDGSGKSDDGKSDKGDSGKSDKSNNKSSNKSQGKKIPQTGDSTNVVAIAALGIAGLVLAGIGIAVKRH